MYELTYSKEYRKQFSKLDKDSQKRINSVLERSRIRPYSVAGKLVSSPYFRLRAGDYRIIIDIKDKELIIHALEVGHRKNIYK